MSISIYKNDKILFSSFKLVKYLFYLSKLQKHCFSLVDKILIKIIVFGL